MNTKVPKPPAKGGMSRLAVAPPAMPANNLVEGGSTGDSYAKDLSFKVTPDFHRRFKAEATLRGLSMKDLLEACYAAYVQLNGTEVR